MHLVTWLAYCLVKERKEIIPLAKAENTPTWDNSIIKLYRFIACTAYVLVPGSPAHVGSTGF